MANPHGNTEGEGGVGGSGGYKQRQLLAKLQGGAAVGYHLLKVGELVEELLLWILRFSGGSNSVVICFTIKEGLLMKCSEVLCQIGCP